MVLAPGVSIRMRHAALRLSPWTMLPRLSDVAPANTTIGTLSSRTVSTCSSVTPDGTLAAARCTSDRIHDHRVQTVVLTVIRRLPTGTAPVGEGEPVSV